MYASLTTIRLATLIALSISFWSSGVFLARGLSAYELWGGRTSAILFVLAFPVALFAIKGVESLLKLTHDEVFPTVVFITMAVTWIHGAALAYIPFVYGTPTETLSYAGAAFLWFTGAVLFYANRTHKRSV